jgi:hypothetical protein
MSQYYENRHESQTVGFEGLNLTGGRQQEIFMSTGLISRDSILQFTCTQFHIASQSCPGVTNESFSFLMLPIHVSDDLLVITHSCTITKLRLLMIQSLTDLYSARLLMLIQRIPLRI